MNESPIQSVADSPAVCEDGVVGRRIDIDFLVSLPEASAELGLSDKALSVYRGRYPNSFPEPLKTVGGVALFDIRELVAWYERGERG